MLNRMCLKLPVFGINRKIFILLVSCCFISPSFSNTITYFVDVAGNDDSVGDNIHPLATIQEAINRTQKIEIATLNNSVVEIMVGEGTFYINKPLVLKLNNDKLLSNIKIVGKGTDKTIVSGGELLPNFKSLNKRLWSADLNGVIEYDEDIPQLFVNGKRCILARTPNSDSYFIPGKASEKLVDNDKLVFRQDIPIEKSAAKVLRRAKQIDEVVFVSLNHWVTIKRKVERFKNLRKKLSVVGESIKEWQYFKDLGRSHFYFENDISFLDSEGEFFYDKKKKKLFYFPRQDDDIEHTIAVRPVAEQLLVISGTEQRHIDNVQISGISFSHTKYDMPIQGENASQSMYLKNAALKIDFADSIRINNCEITHVGEYGIWFNIACDNCSVNNCYIHDLGAGGIKIGEELWTYPDNYENKLTKNITIDNNIIREGSRLFAPGVGVLLTHAANCSITHNEIADFYYTGVSVGWVWGYKTSFSKNNDISYNHIHHLGWAGLCDMAGIYTLGPSEGTTIHNNIIHHVYTFGYGGWGIYLDQGSSNINVMKNLVYECKDAAFFQHFGKDNIVKNNLFVNQINAQLEAERVEEHNSFSFTNNIVCFSKGGSLYARKWDKVQCVIDYNLYWAGKDDAIFNGKKIEKWRSQSNHDSHSIVFDPYLERNNDGHYYVENLAACSKIGYHQMSYDDVGVYGSDDWQLMAEFSKKRADYFDELVAYYLPFGYD